MAEVEEESVRQNKLSPHPHPPPFLQLGYDLQHKQWLDSKKKISADTKFPPKPKLKCKFPPLYIKNRRLKKSPLENFNSKTCAFEQSRDMNNMIVVPGTRL